MQPRHALPMKEPAHRVGGSQEGEVGAAGWEDEPTGQQQLPPHGHLGHALQRVTPCAVRGVQCER